MCYKAVETAVSLLILIVKNPPEDYASQWEPNFALWTFLIFQGNPICYHKSMVKPNHTTKQFFFFEWETDRNNCPDEQCFVEHPKEGQSNPFSLVLQIQGRTYCCLNMAPSLNCVLCFKHKYIGKIIRDLYLESLTYFNTFSRSIESMHMQNPLMQKHECLKKQPADVLVLHHFLPQWDATRFPGLIKR